MTCSGHQCPTTAMIQTATTAMSEPESKIDEKEEELKRVSLNMDIWYLVFEQATEEETNREFDSSTDYLSYAIGQEFKSWLLSLRLLSRGFYAVITPIIYHSVDLSSYSLMTRLTNVSASPSEKVKENIFAYAREFMLTGVSDFNSRTAAAELVAGCKRLERVTWNYHTGFQRLLVSLYLHAFLQNSGSCQFLVSGDDFIIEETGFRSKDKYPEPTGALTRGYEAEYSVSASTRSPKGSVSVLASAVKASLRLDPPRPKLQCVTVNLLYAGFETFLPFDSIFPAMEKLVLGSYVWDHPQSEFEQIWDFSRLRCLSLERKVLEFLKYAPLTKLEQLESLKLSDFDCELDSDSNQESFRGLLKAMLGKLQNLNTLKIEDSNWQKLVPMEVILGMGNKLQKLRKLRLRGQAGTSIEGNMMPMSRLTQLQESCPNLKSLDLDISMSSQEVECFLNLLPQFKQLRKLRLWTDKTLAMRGVGDSDDVDYDSARTIMANLHIEKAGVPFIVVKIYLTSSCGERCSAHSFERAFESRVNVFGLYEQWGSERKSVLSATVGGESGDATQILPSA